jgi:hypothetical protein
MIHCLKPFILRRIPLVVLKATLLRPLLIRQPMEAHLDTLPSKLTLLTVNIPPPITKKTMLTFDFFKYFSKTFIFMD